MQMRVEHHRRRQVVVADDDSDMRSLLAANLRRAGLDVREAVDGKDLMELGKRHEASANDDAPDLVISDVHMPGASGIDAVAQLKSVWPEVPVIIISAFGDSALHDAAARAGAAMVFDKPFDLFELRDAVITLLGY